MGKSFKLRSVQVGQEGTWGTAVVATAKLMEVTEAEVTTNIELDTEPSLGTLAPATSADVVYIDAALSISGKCTMEDDLYFAESMFGTVAPTGVGPYVRAYLAPHDAAYVPAPMSFEYGTSGASYVAAGCLLLSYELEISKRKPWMYKSEWIAKTVAVLGSLAALTTRTPTLVRAQDTVFSIDAAGGTIGTTPVTATLIKAVMKIETNVHLDDFVGNVAPADYTVDQWSASLEITATFNATAKTLADAILAGTVQERLFQFKATRGTNIAIRNFAGVLDGAGQKLFEDENGTIAIKFKVVPKYNASLANWLGFTQTNSAATIL